MFGKSHKNLCIHKESSFSPYKRALTSPHDWWIHTRVSEKRAAQGGKGRTRSLFEQRLKKRKTSRACFPAITKVSHDQESSVCQFIHAFPLFLREAEKTHSQKLMGRKKILPRKKNNMFRNQAGSCVSLLYLGNYALNACMWKLISNSLRIPRGQLLLSAQENAQICTHTHSYTHMEGRLCPRQEGSRAAKIYWVMKKRLCWAV